MLHLRGKVVSVVSLKERYQYFVTSERVNERREFNMISNKRDKTYITESRMCTW